MISVSYTHLDVYKRQEPCYAMEDDADSEYPEGMVFRELLSLYDVLEEDIYALAGRARQILLWDQTHQYCGRCGTCLLYTSRCV